MIDQSLLGVHAGLGVVGRTLAAAHIHGLEVTLLQDLLDDAVLVLGVESRSQNVLGGSVVHALGTLLVCGEDLESGHEVSHGDGGVAITELLVGLDVVDEDKEVLLVLLVVDLGLGGLAACHVDGVCGRRFV